MSQIEWNATPDIEPSSGLSDLRFLSGRQVEPAPGAGGSLKSSRSRTSGIRRARFISACSPEDGNYYLLRHDEGQDFWTVDGFRAGRRK